MLFDVRPKRRRVDLYDFDEEYARLVDALGEPLIVVRGLRRTGKTSLVLTALEESEAYYVLFDFREGYRSRRDLYEVLARGISGFLKRLSRRRKLLELFRGALGSLRGVSVYGFQVSLSWGRDRPLLSELFGELGRFASSAGMKVVLVFDEVQRLGGPLRFEVGNTLAYAYDHIEGLSLILTGSEAGLLEGFLGDPESPLYGRAYVEISTRRLSREESLDFLSRGFAQVGVSVPEEELEEAVNMLNGIIGWLTYYGYSRYKGGRGLEEIKREAVALARRELENFIATRMSRRYALVMRLLAENVRSWRELKRRLEEAEKRPVSDRVLHDILYQLKRHSIINENLEYTDPVVGEAAKTLGRSATW